MSLCGGDKITDVCLQVCIDGMIKLNLREIGESTDGKREF